MRRDQALITLRLSEPFSEIDLKKAYRRMSKLHHPDLGGDETKFKRVQEAYETIKSGSVVPRKFVVNIGGTHVKFEWSKLWPH